MEEKNSLSDDDLRKPMLHAREKTIRIDVFLGHKLMAANRDVHSAELDLVLQTSGHGVG